MDRRAAFFLGAAVISALLIPVTEQAQRWAPAALAIVYVLLSVASWADHRTRTRGRPDRPLHRNGRGGDPPPGPGIEKDLKTIGITTDSRIPTQRARPGASDLDQQ
jgi:hypothetical protein